MLIGRSLLQRKGGENWFGKSESAFAFIRVCLSQVVKNPFMSYMAGNSTNKLEFSFVDLWIKVFGLLVLKFTLN